MTVIRRWLWKWPTTECSHPICERALLAVMLGCGLSREETASLTLKQIQQRDGRWVIVDLVSKGPRLRSVPMPAWAKPAVDRWMDAAGFVAGRVLHAINEAG